MGFGDMAWGNLRRHKGRTVFLLLLTVFSVTTVTSMITVTRAMRAEIGNAFDQIGANILILPEQARRFGYAGVSLPAASVSQRYLPESSADSIRAIKNRESIAVVAPKLLAVVQSPHGPALAVGVRFPAELRLKKRFGRLAVALSGTTGILGALAIAVTMLGSVRERTREIGLMRALGARRKQILALFFLEAGTLGLGGGALGSALGTVLARLLGASLAGTQAFPWHPPLMAAATAGAVLLTLLASLAPAMQAARVDPVRALRFL